MKFIDCSACIGESAVNRLIVNHENYPVYEKVKQPKNAEELLAEMDYNGIDEAVVYTVSMIESGILHGNRFFLDRKENYTGRLHGTIVVAPPFFDRVFSDGRASPHDKKIRSVRGQGDPKPIAICSTPSR